MINYNTDYDRRVCNYAVHCYQLSIIGMLTQNSALIIEAITLEFDPTLSSIEEIAAEELSI